MSKHEDVVVVDDRSMIYKKTLFKGEFFTYRNHTITFTKDDNYVNCFYINEINNKVWNPSLAQVYSIEQAVKFIDKRLDKGLQ